MEHFFAMGGYGAYIWPAYGASFLGLAAMIWSSLRSYSRAKRQLRELECEAPS
jgi:heme exporter protein D